MKIKSAIFTLLYASLLLPFLLNCKKEAIIIPTVTVSVVTNITSTTATSGGEITSDGGASVISRGVCWSANQTPTTVDSKTSNSTGIGSFTSSLTGLTPGATYYLKAYAINSVGTAYSNQTTFSTLALAPVLTTTAASAILSTTATSGGIISSNGGAAVTVSGVCWGTSTNPTTALSTKTTDGSLTGTFTGSITGLTPGTTYYVRAYATNSIGTGYGSEVTFKTIKLTVTDIDGNIYQTIKIGTQIWMVENLKTTKYRNGDPIPNVTGDEAWAALATGAYCWYNNDAATNKTTYGALYNWLSIYDSRNIAPTGWHIPSEAEWTILINYLTNNGYGYQGSGAVIKKSLAATSGWVSTSTAGDVGNDPASNNRSGFTAYPGGNRWYNGIFYYLGIAGFWWSSPLPNPLYGVYHLSIYNDSSDLSITKGGDKHSTGYSVRCLKD